MATYVLIHGAYQGGWIWRVWRRCCARRATACSRRSLDGCAEREHALRPGITTETHGAEIADLLFYEDLHDVVLVGTSSRRHGDVPRRGTGARTHGARGAGRFTVAVQR